MQKRFLAAATLAVLLFACNQKKTNKADVVAVNMDTTISPSADFFMYANGGWIKNNAIPNEESEWGIGNLVVNENLNRLRTINENAAKENAAKGTASQKIGDYRS